MELIQRGLCAQTHDKLGDSLRTLSAKTTEPLTLHPKVALMGEVRGQRRLGSLAGIRVERILVQILKDVWTSRPAQWRSIKQRQFLWLITFASTKYFEVLFEVRK